MNCNEVRYVLPLSEQYRVFVDGNELEVIKGDEYDYVHIITKDIVSVEVKLDVEAEKIALRPTRRAKKFEVENNCVRFLMSRADYYCLEVNGDLSRPLLLFCDEKIEKQLYDGENLLYFPKGYHKLGEYHAVSDTVIFIDEGAFVEGKIRGEGVKNLRIVGNGVLLGTNHDERRSSPVSIANSEDVEINGITIIGVN